MAISKNLNPSTSGSQGKGEDQVRKKEKNEAIGEAVNISEESDGILCATPGFTSSRDQNEKEKA